MSDDSIQEVFKRRGEMAKRLFDEALTKYAEALDRNCPSRAAELRITIQYAYDCAIESETALMGRLLEKYRLTPPRICIEGAKLEEKP